MSAMASNPTHATTNANPVVLWPSTALKRCSSAPKLNRLRGALSPHTFQSGAFSMKSAVPSFIIAVGLLIAMATYVVTHQKPETVPAHTWIKF